MSEQNEQFLGQGWGFPPAFSEGGGDLRMVAGVKDIEESIQILIGTRPFERAMQETYGCNLDEFLFEAPSQQLLIEMEDEVTDALIYHEPRIRVEAVTANIDRLAEGYIQLHIQYVVRDTNTRYNMVYPYYFREATDI